MSTKHTSAPWTAAVTRATANSDSAGRGFAAARPRTGVLISEIVPAEHKNQVTGVVRSASKMGYGLLSFQPAAFLGDERRWKGAFRNTTGDAVWAQIEAGAGGRLDADVLQHGDVRCNRTAYGFFVGETWHPVLDGDDARDLRVRDLFFRHLGDTHFTGTPAPRPAYGDPADQTFG